MMRVGLRVTQLILVGSAVLLLSLPARAERLDWDPNRVTGLAVELTHVLAETAAASVDAPPQATVLQQRTHNAASSRLERVRAAATEFVTKLKAGWGRDETEAYFWQVQVLVRETREIAGDAVHYQKMGERWDASLKLTNKIARYYGTAAGDPGGV